MNLTAKLAIVMALGGLLVACGSDKQATAPVTVPVDPVPSTVAGQSAAPPIAASTAGAIASSGSGTAGKATSAGSSGSAGMGSAGKPATAEAGKAAMSEAGSKAVEPDDKVATQLPLEFTNVDVTRNTKRRYGAPHVAVNPKDPNNIVVLASSNLGYTKDCVPPPPGSDCEMIPAGDNLFLTQPRGFAKTPGFMDIGVFVSFDRGKTFESVDVSDLVPPDHPEVRARGEGPIAALPDGTFMIGFNAINWGNWESQPKTFFPNGGVGVIKSKDGGKTWSWSSFSGTPADWPYGNSDPITGTFYVTSGLAGLSTLGPRSTGEPDSPEGSIADRWISSTNDQGTTWTAPQPLGATSGGRHVGAGHSPAAAAHGILATLFVAGDSASCRTFVGEAATSACVVFQTSTDAGMKWDRRRVPTPAGFTPGALNVLVGASPKQKEHFTVALLSSSGDRFLIYTTPDSGKTWSEAIPITEDASKTHFAPFVATSPTGEFGLMWRTYEPDPANRTASPPIMPYSVWAVITKDGGKTFSKPLRVSKANSPAPPSDPNDAFSFVGDHGPSGMAMDGEGGVYVVWADWTPGERAIFFSAINSDAFTF